MKRFLCLVFGFIAGYYYGKNKDTVDNNEQIQKEIKYLKSVKNNFVKTLKNMGGNMKRKYIHVTEEEVENNEKKEEKRTKKTKKENK